MDKSIERMEQGLKSQGERIGSIEKAIHTLERHDKYITKHAERLDAIEKAPADKWNKFTWLIIAGVAAAIVAFLMGRVL